jgi:sigma-B regulation protein RsbQ
MRRTLPDGVLEIIDNVGHCPHLSAPSASVAAMERFLQRWR